MNGDNRTMWILLGAAAIGAYLWYENQQTTAANAATAATTATTPTAQPTVTQVAPATTSVPPVYSSQVMPGGALPPMQNNRGYQGHKQFGGGWGAQQQNGSVSYPQVQQAGGAVYPQVLYQGIAPGQNSGCQQGTTPVSAIDPVTGATSFTCVGSVLNS
jgi:hypothetical protein